MTQQVLRPSSNQENAAVTGYILFVEGYDFIDIFVLISFMNVDIYIYAIVERE